MIIVALIVVAMSSLVYTPSFSSQQTQNICITVVQCWTNVEDIGLALYKGYTNGLCLLGYNHMNWRRHLYSMYRWFVSLSTLAHIIQASLIDCSVQTEVSVLSIFWGYLDPTAAAIDILEEVVVYLSCLLLNYIETAAQTYFASYNQGIGYYWSLDLGRFLIYIKSSPSQQTGSDIMDMWSMFGLGYCCGVNWPGGKRGKWMRSKIFGVPYA